MAKDDELHDFARRFPEGLLALLGVRSRGRYKVQSIEVKTVKRRIDLVFWPEDPRDPRVYVEYQAWRDPEVERRLAQEVYNHCVQEGSFDPVEVAVIYTETRFARAALPADVGHRRRRVMSCDPLRIVLPAVPPRRLLAEGGSALVALPLVGSRDRVRRDARAWLDRVRSRPWESAEARAAAEDLFVRFLSWRLGNMDVTRLLAEQEDDVVEGTVTGRKLIEKGKKLGKKLGEKRGKKLGEARGREQAFRASVLAALEARLGSVPRSVVARVNRMRGAETLEALLRRAVLVQSVDDLASLFGAGPRRR